MSKAANIIRFYAKAYEAGSKKERDELLARLKELEATP